ncbi:hypothetical protein CMI47_06550 [Candidatus Pacearchaeota archaeon]|nr:hypothetical protein [Candidatus Pacearchaeota archaeon]
MSTLRTVHPVKHIDYSRDDRVDHLFVVGEAGPTQADTAVLLTVADTGLDLVLDSQTAGWRDRPQTQGFSLTWAEIIAAVKSGAFGHNGVVGLTTESVSTGNSNEQEQA